MARSAEALWHWHSIYLRMNRWAKAGVLDRVFEKLQQEQLIRIRIEAVSRDSTIVKVHPDGTGALKQRTASHRQISRRMEHQSSYGCRECAVRSSDSGEAIHAEPNVSPTRQMVAQEGMGHGPRLS
jgi:hypothetical protein